MSMKEKKDEANALKYWDGFKSQKSMFFESVMSFNTRISRLEESTFNSMASDEEREELKTYSEIMEDLTTKLKERGDLK